MRRSLAILVLVCTVWFVEAADYGQPCENPVVDPAKKCDEAKYLECGPAKVCRCSNEGKYLPVEGTTPPVSACHVTHGKSCSSDGLLRPKCEWAGTFLSCGTGSICQCPSTNHLWNSTQNTCYGIERADCTPAPGVPKPACQPSSHLDCKSVALPGQPPKSECVCQGESTWRLGSLECLSEYGRACANSSLSEPRCNYLQDYICAANPWKQCACPTGSTLENINDPSSKCLAAYGGRCSILALGPDPQCKETDPLIFCDTITDPNNPKCACQGPNTFHKDGSCYANYGTFCSLTGNPVPGCDETSTGNQVCDIYSKRCVCQENFVLDSETNTCRRAYGSTCTSGECSSGHFLTCADSRCDCKTGYTPHATSGGVRCEGDFGTWCEGREDCNEGKSLVCGDNHRCGCPNPDEQHYDDVTLSCVAKIGKACNSSSLADPEYPILIQCGRNQVCEEGTCRCHTTYTELDGCSNGGNFIASNGGAALGLALVVYAINSFFQSKNVN